MSDELVLGGFFTAIVLMVVVFVYAAIKGESEWIDYKEENQCVEVDRRQELANTMIHNGYMMIPTVIAVTKTKYKCSNGKEIWR